jgi:hypothetical protein
MGSGVLVDRCVCRYHAGDRNGIILEVDDAEMLIDPLLEINRRVISQCNLKELRVGSDTSGAVVRMSS